MDLGGLDVNRLKANAIEQWRVEAGAWPVKVMPLARLMEIVKRNGGRPLRGVGGYFTEFRYVRLRTPEKLEATLGFARGYLASGVSLWKFDALPSPSDFELRGYSQCPGGNPFDGIVVRFEGAERPQYLAKNGAPAAFPPGLGVPQWELRSGFQIAATEICRLAPGQTISNSR